MYYAILVLRMLPAKLYKKNVRKSSRKLSSNCCRKILAHHAFSGIAKVSSTFLVSKLQQHLEVKNCWHASMTQVAVFRSVYKYVRSKENMVKKYKSTIV